jgi:hypothetical protein
MSILKKIFRVIVHIYCDMLLIGMGVIGILKLACMIWT